MLWQKSPFSIERMLLSLSILVNFNHLTIALQCATSVCGSVYILLLNIQYCVSGCHIHNCLVEWQPLSGHTLKRWMDTPTSSLAGEVKMMTCSGGEALKHSIVFLYCLSVYPPVLRRSVGRSVGQSLSLSLSISFKLTVTCMCSDIRLKLRGPFIEVPLFLF